MLKSNIEYILINKPLKSESWGKEKCWMRGGKSLRNWMLGVSKFEIISKESNFAEVDGKKLR